MRILCVSGENLASFEGRFEVDFEAPPLANAPLFAICGPTGSGKSTLLDAICLAFFDRIPRFAEAPKGVEETSSQDPRQILRRGCGQGWAAVRFADGAGNRYEARWSVRRSAGRPTGALQVQQMCLIEQASGRILCDKRRETKEQLQRILGMNFDQFRRSVLLAQGEFASFIKADIKDRAILLEAITGTTLYAELGRRAYEHHKRMQARGQELSSQLEHLPTLSTEERDRLEQLARDLEGSRQAQSQRRRLLESKLERGRQLEDWNERSRSVAVEQDAAQAEQQALEPARLRLALREDLDAQWEPWLRCRQLKGERQRQQEERVALGKELERIRAELELAITRSKANEAELGAYLERWQSGEEMRRQARALEEEQAGLSLALADLDGQWLPLQENARQAEASLTALQEKMAGRAGELERHGVWAEQNSFAENLHRRENDLSRLQEEWPALCQKEEEQQRAFDLLEQEQTKGELRAAELQAQSELKEQQRLGLLERRKIFLAAAPLHSMRELQQRLAEETDQASQLERTWEQSQAWDLVRRRLLALEEERGNIAATQERNCQEIGRVQEESVVTNARLEEALHGLEMARSRQELTQYRHALRPGEACPLCGSPDHPYAATLPPDALEDLRERARHLTEGSRALLERRSALEQAIRQGEAHLAAKAQEQQLQGQKVQELAATLGDWLQPEGVDWDALQAARQARKDAVDLVRQQIEEAQKHQESLADLAQQEADISEALKELVQQGQTCQEERGRWQAKRSGLMVSLHHIAAERTRLQQVWRELIPHGSTHAGLAGVLNADALHQCRDLALSWANHQQTATGLRAELEELTQGCAVLRAARDHHAQSAAANRGRWKELSRQATEGRSRLKDMIGDKSVRELEQTHFASLNACKEQALACALRKQEAQRNLEHFQAALERLNLGLETLMEELQSLEQRIGAQLSSRSMSWQQAEELFAWPEEQRKSLRNQVEELSQRLAVLTARREECLRQIQKLGNELGEQEPPEQLALALGQLEEEQQRLDAQLLETRVVLQSDGERQVCREQLQQELREHAGPQALAEELAGLIGSANGDKFRKFAQGLTLLQLVEESNHHLAQLAPRYRLVHLEGAELDLGIQDTYMADELRNLASLSGGETFLVSLALALGLSELSSSRASLGSLFVDEGFGSLDGQTLDEAIAALENLQATGRQVGIISHVDSLAEKLGAQVRVVRCGPHRSKIELRGPGGQA
jgi:exonuclease SbcC